MHLNVDDDDDDDKQRVITWTDSDVVQRWRRLQKNIVHPNICQYIKPKLAINLR
jgi:hypothetical protein